MSLAIEQQADAIRGVLARYRELHAAQSRGARAELEKLERLLADAGARLVASFERLCAAAARGVTYIAPRAAANDAPGGGAAAAACAGADDVARAAGEAVTALQFQDLASQLVGHTAARLEALERMAGELARLPEASMPELCEALAAACSARGASPVGQGRMSEGGIELFQS
jgi:hypothetical protein